MASLEYVEAERISLKDYGLDERWLQDRIKAKPSLLGLGDLEVKEQERRQPHGGRLDLLLEDEEETRRYEVELQLGKTDESHIIRTIEYWDNERKRDPEYDHAAVIVAEDITSRFLNVISLFNRHIPLVAIQVNAIKRDDTVSLVFTKVLDETLPGPVEDDDGPATDRVYWEERASKQSLAMTDGVIALLKGFDPAVELNYKKGYVGLAKRRTEQLRCLPPV